MDRETLEQALIARHGAENQKKFAAASVGIAGLGGLGSHIAVHLARLGVGRLVLADFDRVDVTNLHWRSNSGGSIPGWTMRSTPVK